MAHSATPPACVRRAELGEVWDSRLAASAYCVAARSGRAFARSRSEGPFRREFDPNGRSLQGERDALSCAKDNEVLIERVGQLRDERSVNRPRREAVKHSSDACLEAGFLRGIVKAHGSSFRTKDGCSWTQPVRRSLLDDA